MATTFPIEKIPQGVFREYVQFQTDNSESHPAYHFAAFLATTTMMLDRKCHFQNGQFTIYPNLYMLVIGQSGMSRKSSSAKPMMRIIESIDPHMTLTGSFTTESMIQLFYLKPSRFLFLDEMRTLLEQSKKSFAQGLTTKITSLYDCPSQIASEYLKDFKDGERKPGTVASNPYLSILALTTNEWLEVGDSELMGGFMGRFIPIMVKDTDRRWVPTPRWDKDLESRIRQRFIEIRKLKGCFTWHKDALPLWESYYVELMERASTASHYQAGSFGSRTGDYLIKLSMIFQALKYGTHEIMPDVITEAKTFIDLFFDYHLEMLGKVDTTDFSKDISKVTKIIERAGGIITRQELTRASRIEKKLLDQLMDYFKESGLYLEAKVTNGNKSHISYYDPKLFHFGSINHSEILPINQTSDSNFPEVV